MRVYVPMFPVRVFSLIVNLSHVFFTSDCSHLKGSNNGKPTTASGTVAIARHAASVESNPTITGAGTTFTTFGNGSSVATTIGTGSTAGHLIPSSLLPQVLTPAQSGASGRRITLIRQVKFRIL